MGHMHGFGFGLGFLNLLGNILFFMLLFMLFKNLARGGRGYRWMKPCGGHSQRGRHRGGDYEGEGYAEEYTHPQAPAQDWGRKPPVQDEAMGIARERLANGEMTVDAFDEIRLGLSEDSAGTYWNPFGRDGALRTARMRFARGEINLSEYRAVKKALLS